MIFFAFVFLIFFGKSKNALSGDAEVPQGIFMLL